LARWGAVEEFWGLVCFTKKRDIPVWDSTVPSCFMMPSVDALKFEKFFYNDTIERLCRIVRSDDFKNEIWDFNVGFSSKLVKLVLENLGSEPNKAMKFFRWVEENLYAYHYHDMNTYNAMVNILDMTYEINRYMKIRSKDRVMMVKILKRICLT
jgi:hypothetical protein